MVKIPISGVDADGVKAVSMIMAELEEAKKRDTGKMDEA